MDFMTELENLQNMSIVFLFVVVFIFGLCLIGVNRDIIEIDKKLKKRE